MPRIPQIDQDVLPQGDIAVHRANAEEFGVGRGMAQLGESISQTGNSLERTFQAQEETKAAVQLSQAQVDFQKYMHDQIRSGDFNSEDFNQKVQDHVSQIGENMSTVGGRQYFEKASTSLTSAFQKEAFQASAEIAGAQAKAAWATTTNNLSTGVYNQPSSFEAATQQLDALYDSHKAVVGPKAALALKQSALGDLAKSAAKGMLEQSLNEPLVDGQDSLAKKTIMSGVFDPYMNGEDKAKLIHEADVYQRANLTQQKLQTKAEEDAKKQHYMEIGNKLYDAIQDGTATPRMIMTSGLPSVGEQSRDRYLNILKRQIEGKNKSDPTIVNGLFERIHLDNGDSNKIYNENDIDRMISRGEINVADGIKARKEIQQLRLPDGEKESDAKKALFNMAKAKLVQANPMLGLKDDQGQLQLSKFRSYMLDKLEKGKRAGIASEEMLLPGGKNYIGNDIQQFVRSPGQIMQGLVQSNHGAPQTIPDLSSSNIGAAPGAPPPPPNPAFARNPGESPAAFLARKKAQK